ncbi:MAG TPA: hypothetical protein PKK33_11485 [Candidatus Cloacimonadota bacterium]|nr:hypothetical protein [Candidatus Cloacimonadota bacterium]
MYAPVNKSKENSFPTTRQESRAVANSVGQKKSDVKQYSGFKDNRSEVVSQRNLHTLLNSNLIQRKTVIENYGQTCTYGSVFNPQNVVVGHTMNAWLDPDNPIRGQSANVNTSQDNLMAWIKNIYPLAKGAMSVKGHLLNDNLGGTALDNNLYPISKGANGMHLSTAENYVKNAVWKDKKAVKYSVEVNGSTDYTGANDTNALATFQTSVSPWNDVNNKEKISEPIYTANIVSNLGVPKKREAKDKNDLQLPNISGHGLKPLLSPAKAVGNLDKNEKEYRNSQPLGLRIDTAEGYSSFTPTSDDKSGDEMLLNKALAMSSSEFVEEYINDTCRDIIENAIDVSTEITEVKHNVIQFGIWDEFISGLPKGLIEAMEVKEDQIYNALLMFVQEEAGDYFD